KAITDSALVVGFFVIGIYGNAPKSPPDKDNDSIWALLHRCPPSAKSGHSAIHSITSSAMESTQE
ncbi:MAG: hypothetical protein WBE81_20330, partial [Pseudolabrys sp.]